MGFKHWFQGLEMIAMFLVVVALPCFFIGLWGSKMINDLGNYPYPKRSDSGRPDGKYCWWK